MGFVFILSHRPSFATAGGLKSCAAPFGTALPENEVGMYSCAHDSAGDYLQFCRHGEMQPAKYNGQPFEVTPPIDHPKMDEMVKLLQAGPAQTISCDPSPLRSGLCYWNAVTRAREADGALVTGWLILLWPGVYLTAQHHGVMKRPDGSLLDVSAKPIHDPIKDHSIFVVDESIIVDPAYAPAIPNHYVALTNHGRVAALMESLEVQNALGQESADYGRSIGIKTGEMNFALVRGEKPQAIQGLSEEQKSKLREIDQATHAERQKCDMILKQLFNKPPNSEAKHAMREARRS
jgi:hypothetical protein